MGGRGQALFKTRGQVMEGDIIRAKFKPHLKTAVAFGAWR